MKPTDGHHHGGGGGSGGGGTINLLTHNAQVAWALVLAVLLAWHLLALVVRRTGPVAGAAHLALVGGMVVMTAPLRHFSGRWQVWALCYVALTLLCAPLAVRGVRIWTSLTVDGACMAWMYAEMGGTPALLTYLLTALQVVLAIAWAQGALGGRPLDRLVHCAMAAAMAYLLLAMQPQFGRFLNHALRDGSSEQGWWGLAVLGLLLRLAADRRTVRRLVS